MKRTEASKAEYLRRSIDSQAKRLGKPLCLVEIAAGRFRIMTFQEASSKRIVYRSDKGYTGE